MRAYLARQVHQEFGPTSRTVALNFYAATMHFDHSLDQSQADPQATLGARDAVIGLSKKVEDMGQHACGYTNTVVLNVKSDGMCGGINAQLDPSAGVGVLGSIVEQIANDLG